MRQSLHRTWAALGLAMLAVLILGMLVGRDFVRDVYPLCPGSLESPAGANEHTFRSPYPNETAIAFDENVQLLYDEKHDRGMYATRYDNVRVVWRTLDRDGALCTCGTIPLALSGEVPSDLRLYRDHNVDRFVVKGRDLGTGAEPTLRATFRMTDVAAHHLQTDRIFTMHHLPALVALFALGALGVALVRSRRAISYALRMHAWTEATLTPEGLIENDTGMALATLEQSRIGRLPPGPILVAPSSLSTSGLYRDMPIVAQRNVAEGSHARWKNGTMLRLRDARALAVMSTLCTALAFGARLIA